MDNSKYVNPDSIFTETSHGVITVVVVVVCLNRCICSVQVSWV